MFVKRAIEADATWLREYGVKVYTVAASNDPVERGLFVPRMRAVLVERGLDLQSTPAFAIFHQGVSYLYLVVCWWGNDNELFTSVSVKEGDDWVEDPKRFSFCVYDLEIIWAERNFFIDTIYCESPSLQRYQSLLFTQAG